MKEKFNGKTVNAQETSKCVIGKLHGTGGGKAPPASRTTAGVREDGGEALLYLSCFNSDKEQKRKGGKRSKNSANKRGRGGDETPKNKEYKIMKSLRENIKYWGDRYGIDHFSFLTITVPDKEVLSVEELRRRFNNFNRQFGRINGFKWWYKGIEPQKRGQFHFHLVVHCEKSVEPEKVDWDAYKAMNEEKAKNGLTGKYYNELRKLKESCTPEVTEMWKKLQRICKASQLGRSEFLPIRSANSIASYVGKYLNKCFADQENGDWAKGLRRFAYARGVPQPHGRQFSWVNTGKSDPSEVTWREKVTAWAHGVGVKFDDYEDLTAKYGKAWAINQRDEINYYGMVWQPKFQGKKLHHGHSKPSLYPTGLIGNPLPYMGSDKSLDDPFETSENDLWERWMAKPKKTSNEWKLWQKWKRAQEHKMRHAYLYD